MAGLTPGAKIAADADSGTATVLAPGGQVWVLNETATVVVRALAGGEGLAGAEAALAGLYPEIPAELLREDIEALVSCLVDAGALER